jgi:hypothetical protein
MPTCKEYKKIKIKLPKPDLAGPSLLLSPGSVKSGSRFIFILFYFIFKKSNNIFFKEKKQNRKSSQPSFLGLWSCRGGGGEFYTKKPNKKKFCCSLDLAAFANCRSWSAIAANWLQLADCSL